MNNIEKGILRQLLLKNHVAFTRYFFKQRKNQSLILNPHHWIIGETLDRVFNGEISRLIVNLPPRYTKTEEVVISFIARGFALNPSCEFVHSSYADTLVRRNSREIKDLIMHESFQELWPMQLKKDSQSVTDWRIDGYNGRLLAAASGSTITGFGAGLMQDGFTGALIIDDPLKPKDSYSEVIRTSINNNITGTFMSRLAHKKVPIIIVMQRLHEDDMTGYLLNGGTGEKWHHLCLPAEITDETKIYKKAQYPYGIPIEYNLPNGPLWEYKHTLEDLQMMRKADRYTTSAQYDQQPSPHGGGIFRPEDWRYYPANIPMTFEYRFITADTAQKTKEHNDYSAIGCWGIKGGNLYLIDICKGKWESPDLRRILLEFYNKHKNDTAPTGKLRWVYIEDKSSGTDLIQSLRNDMPISAVQRNVDKVTRAHDCVPYVCTGKVLLPDSGDWVQDFIQEVCKFTPLMTHRHDDQVDMFMDAVMLGLGAPKNEAGSW